MKISFCTTCANRLYQLKQTFDENIELINNHSNTEWVLVNFGSTDELDLFIQEKLKNLTDRFVYVKEVSGRNWSLPIAKNVAHVMGSGDVLFSLDCDNFIGNTIKNIEQHFIDSSDKVLHEWSENINDGTFGRIGLNKSAFYKLGGYDELLYPMGTQDYDLLRRALAIGCKLVKNKDCKLLPIQNTEEEKLALCKQYNLSIKEFHSKNLEVCLQNIVNNKLKANNGIFKLYNIEIFRGGLYY